MMIARRSITIHNPIRRIQIVFNLYQSPLEVASYITLPNLVFVVVVVVVNIFVVAGVVMVVAS